MQFRIADTFADSLARLTGEEQKAVKTTAFDLQLNPANPGMRFHKLEKARDKNFSSVRVNDDLRLIVHRTPESLLLCYVDHHDKAYAWAERRKLETHPRTGAAQLVEVVERVEEIAVRRYVEAEKPLPVEKPLFTQFSADELLGYGVPPDWLPQVQATTEDNLLDLIEHLPREAAEALLQLATGSKPRIPEPALVAPFDHPDARSRFYFIADAEALQRAFEYPWDKWTVFLHPAQRETVEKSFGGPARVSGSAGTGKTIVALHRAVYLARQNPDSRVLLTTFSEPLANALRTKLKRLIGNEPRIGERVEVHSVDAIARRLYERNIGKVEIAPSELIRQILADASADVGVKRFSAHFLGTEWADVVDAWQIESWEAYRDVARLGRKTRLPEKQREELWKVFQHVRNTLHTRGLITQSRLLNQLASQIGAIKHPPFDYVIVDESQDLGVGQLRLLAALGAGRPNSLFFAGDLGQRIFQQPFSWKSLGVDIRGRSRTLRINYRTSQQIRAKADRLLGPQVADVDGNVEDRRGAIAVFKGPEPQVVAFNSPAIEVEAVATWLRARAGEGVQPHEIAVFVRSTAQVERARETVQKAAIPFTVLDEQVQTISGRAAISTMHLAKGLEFRSVVVMACDDEVIPLQERIESVADDSDLEEVYNTERQLLYVACTRARENLLVTGVKPVSEFLDDLTLRTSSEPDRP